MTARVAVIGAGRIAAYHLKGYQRAGADVVAIADIDSDRARNRAESVGARVYTDFREMLERERPDGVSICTPPNVHAEQVVVAARAGSAILTEKPFATTLAQGRDMLAEVRSCGVLLAVNFAHRFYAATEIVRDMLSSGRLGRVHSFHVRFGVDYTQSVRQWIFEKEIAGGGAFMDTASHGVDLFRYLVGEVDRVSAVLRHGRSDIEVEDFGILTLESNATDAVGIVEADWSTPGADYRWSIHGSAGAAYVDYIDSTLRYRFEGESEWFLQPLHSDARFARFDGVVEDFVNCVGKGGTPRATGDDGVRSLEIVTAAYESAQSGCFVDVPL